MRNKFVTKENLPIELQYLCDVNNHVRESAVFELVNAYKIGFNKQRINENFKFDIKYKSRKLDKSIVIPKSAVSWKGNRLSLCPKLLKLTIKCFNSMNKRTEKQKIAIKHECRLVIDEIGRFYLHIPISVNERVTENQGDKIGAMDPGVRTPFTLYSPNGDGIKFGDNDFKRLTKLCITSDKIQSQHDKCLNKRKKRMFKRAFLKNNIRIRHLVDEVHWKVIKYITDNYKEVLLPSFEVSNITKRLKRKIRSKTVRSMLTWRHFTFKQRLIDKASKRNVILHIVGEEYTTKTCGACGYIKNNVGGSKIFNCDNCKVKYDRDLGAARNIFLKHSRLRCN